MTLRILTFSELEKETFRFDDFVGIRQSWKTRARFSYLNKDRPDSGLTLILCREAVYTFPDGRELRASVGDLLFLPQSSNNRALRRTNRPPVLRQAILKHYLAGIPAQASKQNLF